MNEGYSRLLEINPRVADLPWSIDNVLFLIDYAYTVGKQDGMNDALRALQPDAAQAEAYLKSRMPKKEQEAKHGF